MNTTAQRDASRGRAASKCTHQRQQSARAEGQPPSSLSVASLAGAPRSRNGGRRKLTAHSMGRSPSEGAMRALSEVVNTARSEELAHGWLRLQARLRASADQLIMAEAGDGNRSEVQRGCQAYLEMISQCVDAASTTQGPEALKHLQQRSERYLERVALSTSHLVACGGDLLTTSLRKGGTVARNATAQTRAVIGPGTGLGSSALLHIGGLGEGSSSSHDSRPRAQSSGGEPKLASGANAGEPSCSKPSCSSSSAAEGQHREEGSGPCVLTHGFSVEVLALLQRAAKHEHFTLLVAEDRPDGSGHRTAAEMAASAVPVRLIEFSAVARFMASVELVLVGADAVLADGGVLAPIGTLTMAYAAHAHGRPFYVAAPHHRFSSTHHLDATAQTVTRAASVSSNRDNVGGAGGGGGGGVEAPRRASSGSGGTLLRERPMRDATPPSLVTLLLTDVGVLTTEAVADLALNKRC